LNRRRWVAITVHNAQRRLVHCRDETHICNGVSNQQETPHKLGSNGTPLNSIAVVIVIVIASLRLVWMKTDEMPSKLREASSTAHVSQREYPISNMRAGKRPVFHGVDSAPTRQQSREG
jgi:hypothetical protein